MPAYRGKFHLKLNVCYEVRDKDGNLKPQFNENRLGLFLLKTFRRFIKHPINEAGQVKEGLLNYLAAYGLRTRLTGSWQNQKIVSNLVVTTGKALVAARLMGIGSPAAAIYIANGTGTTAAAAGDTALEAETAASGLARASDTPTAQTTDTTDDTARLSHAFSAGASVAVTECGVLNAASNGTLLARQVFSAYNLVSGDTWTPTWNFDVD